MRMPIYSLGHVICKGSSGKTARHTCIQTIPTSPEARGPAKWVVRKVLYKCVQRGPSRVPSPRYTSLSSHTASPMPVCREEQSIHRHCGPSLFGQETEHVKIGHVKIDRAHFRVHFREHWKITREHSRGSLRGDPLVRFAQRKPQPSWTFPWTSSCTLSWAFS